MIKKLITISIHFNRLHLRLFGRRVSDYLGRFLALPTRIKLGLEVLPGTNPIT